MLVPAKDGYLCLNGLGAFKLRAVGVKIQEKYTFFFPHKWREVTVLYSTKQHCGKKVCFLSL